MFLGLWDRPLESLFETLARKQAPQAILTSQFPAWIAPSFDELSYTTRSRVEVVALPPVSSDELEVMGVGDAEALVAATEAVWRSTSRYTSS